MTPWDAIDQVVKSAKKVAELDLAASACAFTGGLALAIVGGGLLWVVPAIAAPALIYRVVEAMRTERQQGTPGRIEKQKAILDAEQEAVLETARRVDELRGISGLGTGEFDELRERLMRSQARYDDALEEERRRISE